MLNLTELNYIYFKAAQEKKDYTQFITHLDEKAKEFGALALLDLSDGIGIQITGREFDNLNKDSMENVQGHLSESGYVHINFEYDGIAMSCVLGSYEITEWMEREG